MEALISIVVPVYNAGAFIKQTMEMVCQQTWQNWELLLVDDCSQDNSRLMIEEYCKKDSRIHLIIKEKNAGAAQARNTGVQQAKGRYLAFLDADDVWLPQKLELELEFLRKRAAAFVFTAYEFGDEEARGTGKIVQVPKQLTYRKALSRTVIFTSTVLFDLEKIDRELIQMPNVASEDTATWWKILRNGYTAYGFNQVLTIYRRPKKSLSSNKLAAIQRIWNLYRKEEKLSLPFSLWNFTGWAVRAAFRRI